MRLTTWKTLPFESAVHSRGSGNSGLPTKEWLPDGQFPVIGQGAEDIEGWTEREDLLLTPTRPVVLYGGHTRRVKHVTRPFVPGPNVKILQPVPEVDSKFLYYFLIQLPVESKGYADHFPLVRKCDIPVPTLDEQQRIVALLDDAFAGLATAKANTERNLQSARAIFESHLQSVFSQRRDGWVETTLGNEDLLKIIDGDRGVNYPNGSDFQDEGYCLFMNTKNVRPDGFEFEAKMFISEEKDRLLRKGKLQRGDVVLTTRGTIGNVGIYSDDIPFANIRINSGMLILRPNRSALLPSFLFELFRSEIVKEQIRKQTTGTAQPQLPIKTLVNFTIPVPTKLDDQAALVRKLRAFEPETQRLTRLYERKLAALEELKKSLLHQAFNGDL
jgi:type I restriction enzyme S subunit